MWKAPPKSHDFVQEHMSCFGGLSPVLSNIGHALRLHCGTIVCAPSVAQDGVDHLDLPGSTSREDLADDIGSAQLKGRRSCCKAAISSSFKTVIVCAPHVSVQEGADHLGLPGSKSSILL